MYELPTEYYNPFGFSTEFEYDDNNNENYVGPFDNVFKDYMNSDDDDDDEDDEDDTESEGNDTNNKKDNTEDNEMLFDDFVPIDESID
ncbi:MAG: hypothetical protein IJ272_05990 [Clostridia bacterium]|nr:hypothetical protein [Clostridia bacterium]